MNLNIFTKWANTFLFKLFSVIDTNTFDLEMATSKKIQEILGDVTECPICTETLEDPKCLSMHPYVLSEMSQSILERQAAR